MRLIRKEFLKLYGGQRGFFLLVGLLFFNVTILYLNNVTLQDIKSYSIDSYRHFFDDVKEKDAKIATSEINESLIKLEASAYLKASRYGKEVRQEDFDYITDIYQITPKKDFIEYFRSGAYLKYTDSIESEHDLYRDMLKELGEYVGYDTYLEKLFTGAQGLAKISLFADENSFSSRNIDKTAKDFEHLKGNQIEFDISKGVTMATEFLPTDLIAISGIFIICFLLITREKETNQLTLVKTMYNGRGRLALSKYMVGVISCVLFSVILYMGNYLVASATYGFGNLDRTIQSISNYQGSNLSITVMEYLLYFIVLKAIVYVMLMSLIYFICVASKHTIQIYVVNVVIFVVSAVFYFTLSENSYLALFKYINLFQMMNVASLLGEYRNLNILSYPVNSQHVFVIIIPLTTLLFMILGIIMFARQKILHGSKSRFVQLIIALKQKFNYKLYRHTNLWSHEIFKIMVKGRGLLILLLGFGAFVYMYSPVKEVFLTPYDVYYKQYMMKLEGTVTDKTEDYFTKEMDRLEKIKMESKEEYDDNQETALKFVMERAEYAKGVNGGYLLYDKGYGLLTGLDAQTDMMLAIKVILITLLILAYVWSVEHEDNAIKVIRTTYYGRKRLFRVKFIISLVLLIVVLFVVYGVTIIETLNAYGLRAIDAPAASMPHLSKVPEYISILQYLIIISVIRIIGFVLMVLLIFTISNKAKSMIYSVGISIVVLVLPIILILLNLSIFNFMLITPLLLGNVIYNPSEISHFKAHPILNYLTVGSMLVGIIYYCRRGLKSVRTE